MIHTDSVSGLRGVGDRLTASLSKMGVRTVGDLLEHYPVRYEDRTLRRRISEMRQGESVTFDAVVIRGELQRARGKSIARLHVRDETGQAVLVWFNQPYRATQWKSQSRITVFGRVNRFRDAVHIELPEVEPISAAGSLIADRIVPVYPLTQGLGARTLRKLIDSALACSRSLPDPIPAGVLTEHGLMDKAAALKEIHFPTDWEAMRRAKRRIVFEEFFVLQCLMAILRSRRTEGRKGARHSPDGPLLHRFRECLPFRLTEDQSSAYDDIRSDMESDRPMHRLLQGDVGSGKTAVALMALAKTVENGMQGVLMAPTEILAEQHFRSCSSLFASLGLRVELLTGRVRGTTRKSVLSALQEGSVDLLIGTHALLQPDVVFRHLGLAITDEQHRFGVNQRALLCGKGEVPHTLVMSATPIPRTMALTLYGDMDVSVIRQLPPGRQPVTTVVRSGVEARERVYRFLASEVAAGRQGYVVCPLVEESEALEAQSATAVYRELASTVLRDVSCSLLHGRMTAAEKERVMRDFSAGKTGVLVATTVIEVGINVPRASMMIVEDAARFGLAQLHQLRGRVGRGSDKSYCVLLHGDSGTPVPDRLRVLTETADGFVVAEQDLQLRGPGQFLGYRQHGLPEMKMASLADDPGVLVEAREAGLRLMRDPGASARMREELQEKLDRFLGLYPAG